MTSTIHGIGCDLSAQQHEKAGSSVVGTSLNIGSDHAPTVMIPTDVDEMSTDQKTPASSVHGDGGYMITGERQRKKIIECPHTDRKHYAKNMCHNCYHRMGKSKKAYACGHPHKSHYSSGMCQNCYLAKYYLKRKQKQLAKNQETETKTDQVQKRLKVEE